MMAASPWCFIFSCTAITASDIYYRCFKGTTDNYFDTPSGDSSGLIENLDTSIPTAFYIHGWKETCQNDSAMEITSALLSRDSHNVCCLDWSKLANDNYVTATIKTRNVAETFSKDLKELYNLGLQSKEPHLIGFSLGAHIAGFTGRNLFAHGYALLSRITALDAAFPLFYYPTCYKCDHLKSSDAEMIDSIHVDGGIYGALWPVGKCDFYPNRGKRIQKGCPIVPTTLDINEILPTYRCSHDRSWKYYSEAIRNSSSHIGLSCDSFGSFENNSCAKNPTVSIGLDMKNNGCSGTYYYTTRSEFPYGQGIEGTNP